MCGEREKESTVGWHKVKSMCCRLRQKGKQGRNQWCKIVSWLLRIFIFFRNRSLMVNSGEKKNNDPNKRDNACIIY